MQAYKKQTTIHLLALCFVHSTKMKAFALILVVALFAIKINAQPEAPKPFSADGKLYNLILVCLEFNFFLSLL